MNRNKLPGGAPLTGPATALPRNIARWRFAYRAYDHISMHRNNCPMALCLSGLRSYFHAPEQLPDDATLIGPTITFPCTGTIARWRYAYRAYDHISMNRNNCPMALRLSGLRSHFHEPEQLPDGATLIGPTMGEMARFRRPDKAEPPSGTFSFTTDSFTADTPGTNKRVVRRASSSQ